MKAIYNFCSTFFLGFIILGGLLCSNQPFLSDGGGTETVIGKIVFADGTNAAGARVIIIPHDYNPLKDTDSLVTNTDNQGSFVFSSVKPGTYNIISQYPQSQLQMFHPQVEVTKNPLILSPDTLKEPGTINIIMADTVDTINGYVFIRGTTFFRSLSKGNMIPGGLYSLILDSVPAAVLGQLNYMVKNNPDEPSPLLDSIIVPSLDTVVVEVFTYLVVIGSIVYDNGILASGIEVRAIPQVYIPFKDNDLPAYMTSTTDINGKYTVRLTRKGTYSIQARHPGQNLNLIQPLITVDRDTVLLSAHTLKKPGRIKLILPDTMNTTNGYVFIKGSTYAKKLSQGIWLDSNFYLLIVDSIPATRYPAIFYAVLKNDQNPIQITDSFTVSAGKTVLLEAFTHWTHYTETNSGLPSNVVLDMAIDSSGYKWFGTDQGAVLYDGRKWITYNRINSGLVSDTVMSISIDPQGVKWFGTTKGVTRFDGTVWDTFTTANSELPDDSIFEILATDNEAIWIGTDYGAAKFDGVSQWNVYTPGNSPLPHPEVYCIAVDHDEYVWLGTDGGGLVRFDGINWDIFVESNSSLPSQAIFSIAVDDQNNKWIGTFKGVAFYNNTNWDFFHIGSHAWKYTVSAIGIDSRQVKWLGTYEGGRLYSFDDINMKRYNTENCIISPRAFEMFAIVVDQLDNKWITTSRYGIYVRGPIGQH